MTHKLTVLVGANPYGERCAICGRVGPTLFFKIEDDSIASCMGCLTNQHIKMDIELPDDVFVSSKKTRIKSKKFEDSIANDIGGRRQAASGASTLAGFKGDVRKRGEWLIEHKFTESPRSYTLKWDDLKHLMVNADKNGEEPAFVISYSAYRDQSFALIRYSKFLELINETKTGGEESGPSTSDTETN